MESTAQEILRKRRRTKRLPRKNAQLTLIAGRVLIARRLVSKTKPRGRRRTDGRNIDLVGKGGLGKRKVKNGRKEPRPSGERGAGEENGQNRGPMGSGVVCVVCCPARLAFTLLCASSPSLKTASVA